MAVIEIEKGVYVDPDPVEAEPGCIRAEPDSGVFRDYLLSRIQTEGGDVASEIDASMRAGRSFGDALLDAIESLPESKTRRLRTWIEEVRATRIYAYVRFPGLSRLLYGLMLTAGGPRDEILDEKGVGGYENSDSFAPSWDFSSAMKNVDVTDDYAFEEVPLVEVTDEEDYERVLEAMGFSKNDSMWKGSGLYDFRERPPLYAGSVAEYERESLESEAEHALEFMFQDNAWQGACKMLLEGGD